MLPNRFCPTGIIFFFFSLKKKKKKNSSGRTALTSIVYPPALECTQALDPAHQKERVDLLCIWILFSLSIGAHISLMAIFLQSDNGRWKGTEILRNFGLFALALFPESQEYVSTRKNTVPRSDC